MYDNVFYFSTRVCTTFAAETLLSVVNRVCLIDLILSDWHNCMSDMC